MSKAPLFREERQRIIIERLKEEGRVAVSELSELLEVSAVTIRQDLKTLEASNLLQRTHGGAVPPVQYPFSPELSFDVRLQEASDEKAALAEHAASFVESGHSIALDASTTVFAMLPHLKKLDRLTIVTNSLIIAQHCLDSPQIDVLVCGGKLRRDSISLVGRADTLPALNLNSGFYSAHGITLDASITESNDAEVAMKRAMMQRSVANYVLVDARKWGKIAPYPFADFDEIETIITSDKVAPSTLQSFQQAGVDKLAIVEM